MPRIEYMNPIKNFIFVKFLTQKEMTDYIADCFEDWDLLTVRNFTNYSKFNQCLKNLTKKQADEDITSSTGSTTLVHTVCDGEDIKVRKESANPLKSDSALNKKVLHGCFDQDQHMGFIQMK
jgi:hypothetical protein